MKNIIFTKEFLENLELYGTNRKSLVRQINDLKSSLEQSGFTYKIFEHFDINSLGKNFFRVKFIPYRVIIKILDDEIIFIDLFKRKGKSDYKKYN